MIYVALDGDDVGEKIERSFIENDERNIANISKEVTNAIQKIADYLQHIGFEIIFYAGDSILCKGKEIDAQELSDYLSQTDGICTFSIGIGNTLEKTYIALRYAKSNGKNKLVRYGENNQLEIIY